MGLSRLQRHRQEVTGGISTNIKSTSSQKTSVQNWVTAPAITGPRQTTGWFSLSRIRLIDITCVPFSVIAGKSTSPLPVACSVSPKDFGTEGPVISASRTAARYPRRCISAASRQVTRDLPTPPFPLTTAITFFTDAPSCRYFRKSTGSEHFSAQFEQS